MSSSTTAGLTLADLDAIVAYTDPSVVLVPPRILRRVIKHDRGLGGLGLQVPHRKSYLLRSAELLRIADRAELGIDARRVLPETVLLLPRPDSGRLQRRPRGIVLLKLWRLLFHIRVHQALRARSLDSVAVQTRVHRLGAAAFAEVRAVLQQENFALPPGDDATFYEEFVALYLELWYFARHLIRRYFPTLPSPEIVNRLLAEDVDAEHLFKATRPLGAPEPDVADDPFRQIEGGDPLDSASTGRHVRPDEAAHARWMAQADSALTRGNAVRTIRLRRRALDVAPQGRRGATRAALERALVELSERVRRALGIDDRDRSALDRGLRALVGAASEGFWPVESRLLFDLQNACLDSERELYAVDVVEVVVTWGRRPLKRPLPNLRFVLIVKHLRAALGRLTAVHMADPVRRPFAALLRAALQRAETAMRDRFRPLLQTALDEVGLRPESQAERLARSKMIEELLDRVAERSFLNMSDLRDAIARNRLKLPDLSGPMEFVLGDPLIRANRRLAYDLDGVYYRGEIYLRWLQRFSSLFFGTLLGRLLTLYLILPLLSSFIILKAAEELYELGIKFLAPAAVSAAHEAYRGEDKALFLNVYTFTFTSLFMLGLLHSAAFRRGVLAVLRALWWIVRAILYDLPAAFFRLPWVRAVLQSRAWLLFYLFILKPLLCAILVGGGVRLLGAGWRASSIVGGAVFLAAFALLNSRLGMRLEEVAADGLIRTWTLMRDDLLPGLFRAVMALFKWLVEQVDRFLYSIDEWLRFREGENRVWLYVKPVLGLVWFVIAYFVRFCVNLLIEPQINPIKHFPVVTVSHKVLWLGLEPTADALARTFHLEKAQAIAATGLVFSIIPGIFGFLAWELKENWRLYRANQPATLEPMVVGSHGETVRRLFRPGFHSGTLPKLFARLRRSERRSETRSVRYQREALHHVEEDVRHFVERDLLAVLAGSRAWGGSAPTLGTIHLGTNSIEVELNRSDLGAAVHLEIDYQAGYLLAGFAVRGEGEPPGWIARLGAGQRAALANALAGFYKEAGIDLVREQVRTLLPTGAAFSIDDRGLLVWPGPRDPKAVYYDLGDEEAFSPRPAGATSETMLQPLEAQRLLFSRTPILWRAWVEAWERDAEGKGHELLAAGVRLLPI
jgi:hypothetical protein